MGIGFRVVINLAYTVQTASLSVYNGAFASLSPLTYGRGAVGYKIRETEKPMGSITRRFENSPTALSWAV